MTSLKNNILHLTNFEEIIENLSQKSKTCINICVTYFTTDIIKQQVDILYEYKLKIIIL